MAKKVFFITVFICGFCISQTYAAENSVTPYFTAGRKSQTDVTEERDLSGNFKYTKFGISSKLSPSKELLLKAGFEDYSKKFTEASLPDVDAKTYKVGLDYLFLDTEESLFKAGADFNLRNKRYDESPVSEYDRTKAKGHIKFTSRGYSSLGLEGGINNYEYINNSDSDVLKTFIKLSPQVYIADKHINLSGFYKIRWVDESADKKDLTETILSIRGALKLDMPFLYKLKCHFEHGRDNTQDTEDREDSLRYKYGRWEVTSYYKISDELKTQVEYGHKKRTYFTSPNNYKNWYIKDGTSFLLLKKEEFDLSLLAGVEHKETDFRNVHKKSYIKNKLSGGLSFLKRADWALKPEFSFANYNYASESTSDQKSYKTKVSLRKYLKSPDMLLEGSFWYKWKDYKYKSDIEQWSASISCEVRF